MAYIYKITNLINNKSYIGKTEKTNPIERFEEHIAESIRDKNKDRPLYRAIRKYGYTKFNFEIIEQTDSPSEREQYYIMFYNTYGANGYNATLGGDGKKYINIDKDLLYKKYDEFKNQTEVAKFFNCHVNTIHDKLIEFEIPIKKEIIQTQAKLISCYDKQGNFIIDFEAVQHGATWLKENGHTTNKSIHGISSHITQCAKGIRKSAYGFVWKYNN